MDESTPIPIGLCQCGCGRPTKIAPGTDSRRGWVKGRPLRFALGHNSRPSQPPPTVGPTVEPGDIVVPLSRGYYAVVDSCDEPIVRSHRWHVVARRKRFYAVNGDHEYLHRVVTAAPSGIEIDHADLDGLNCRRRNLREATRSGQVANSGRMAGASGYRGVYPVHGSARWSARIGHNDRVSLGTFDTPEEAARAFDAAARERYGVFARLNFPGPGERGVGDDPAALSGTEG